MGNSQTMFKSSSLFIEHLPVKAQASLLAVWHSALTCLTLFSTNSQKRGRLRFRKQILLYFSFFWFIPRRLLLLLLLMQSVVLQVRCLSLCCFRTKDLPIARSRRSAPFLHQNQTHFKARSFFMEIIELILGLGNYIVKPACGYLRHHKKLEEDVDDLRGRLRVLNSRKVDVETRVKAEVCSGNIVCKQVENWLEDVQRINDKMQAVEEKLRNGSFFSRAQLGKLVRKKIEAVKEISQQGSFPEGLVIDKPLTIGITLPTENLKGEITVKEKIWEYLMGREVGLIGVFGIGGVGKTTIMKHVNNELLKESQFDKVIWVTVSHPLNVVRLQQKIASAMEVGLPENMDELWRASRLMDIMKRVKYVLILDDVWDKFTLERVGIPRPTMENGCKLVITGRKVDVCNYLGCQLVKVQPLSKQESLNLFLDKVGREILQIPNLDNILNLIVEECAGLPLAIVVIAGSLIGVNDIHEWRNALNELQERARGINGGSEEEIFERLKFSYDRLPDSRIQNCFLYCSLYPEDCVIGKDDLIEHWIDEGLIEELGSRQTMYDKGHAILNGLENNCLLEKASYEGAVKLHDVVRDMALHIKSTNPRFMVKAGMGLVEMLNEREWTKDLDKVSMMHNEVSYIPENMSPECPTLSTLILQRNQSLIQIPDCFFAKMRGLKFLDLSYTNIKVLPNSIANLENLTTLILCYCMNLKSMPSLASLKALKKLDLNWAGIEVVPEGIEMLSNLQYLDLYCRNLVELPSGIFSKLSRLQYLVLYWKSTALKVRGEEVAKLSQLETFKGQLDDLEDFNNYVKSKHFTRSTGYVLSVGSYPMHSAFSGEDSCKRVIFGECQIGGENGVLLPTDLEKLEILRCNDLRSLTDISVSLQTTAQLKTCNISDCEGIECVLDMVSASSLLLNNPEHLNLGGLPNFRALVNVEGPVATCPSSGITLPALFSSLKTLEINGCPRVKKLFPFMMLQGIQNLQEIMVSNCKEMEEIIVLEEKKENRTGESSRDATTTTINLPKLSHLYLHNLPELKSICRAGAMVCDSLTSITTKICPKLKSISLHMPLLGNGQPSPPPVLKRNPYRAKAIVGITRVG